MWKIEERESERVNSVWERENLCSWENPCSHSTKNNITSIYASPFHAARNIFSSEILCWWNMLAYTQKNIFSHSCFSRSGKNIRAFLLAGIFFFLFKKSSFPTVLKTHFGEQCRVWRECKSIYERKCHKNRIVFYHMNTWSKWLFTRFGIN